MIKKIKHIINTIKSKIHERKKETQRSHEWRNIRDQHLESNNSCAACGSKNKLQVHHIQPFHIKPELELTLSNLITLCMSDQDCHLMIGHGDDFKCYNPEVVDDAKKFFKSSVEERTMLLKEIKLKRRL